VNLVDKIRAYLRGRRVKRLVSAVCRGKLSKVEALLKKRPELICTKDAQGMTPLHWASMAHNKEITEFLVKRGAALDALDDLFGATPLVLAVARGLKPQVEILLASNANPNTRDRHGRTPLERVREGDTEAADLLRRYGAEE
jgi:ankyrin repeat protein